MGYDDDDIILFFLVSRPVIIYHFHFHLFIIIIIFLSFQGVAVSFMKKLMK